MIKKMDHRELEKSETEGITSWFHFSFEEMTEVLISITEFDVEPLNEMILEASDTELTVAYIMEGKLLDEHDHELTYGDIIALSGIQKQIRNHQTNLMRLIQFRFCIDQKHKQMNERINHVWNDLVNQWLSCSDEYALHELRALGIKLQVTMLSGEHSLTHHVNPGHHCWLMCMDGEALVNGLILKKRDTMMVKEESLQITSQPIGYLLLLDIKS